MRVLPLGLVLAAFAQPSASSLGAAASESCASVPMPVARTAAAESMPNARVDTSRLARMPIAHRASCQAPDSARLKPLP